MMNEAVKFLTDNAVQYLATTDRENRPRVRPFQFMLEKDGKLYFCTSRQKEVYAEIQNNSHVEICVASPDFAWMRLRGQAVFTEDTAIKSAVFPQSPLVSSLYKTPDNPVFAVFYLEDARAVIADFSGRPPREVAL